MNRKNSVANRSALAGTLAPRRTMRNNRSRWLNEIRATLPPLSELRLLDYGCAYGYFLDEARGYFKSVTGAEISEQVATIGRERFGLHVEAGNAVMEGFPTNHFDLITMWDVIEHLANPRETLIQAARVLRSGGEIRITTGDLGSPLARLLGRRWRLINPPQHISYFSEATLRRLLKETGFQVVAVRRVGKLVSLRFVMFTLRYLTSLKFHLLGPALRFADHNIYVNLFDAISVTARRIDGGSTR